MLHRIEVSFKADFKDAAGIGLKNKIASDLGFAVGQVRTIDAYTIDGNIDAEQAFLLAKTLFCDPVAQEVTVDEPMAHNFDWLIEVGFKPGVTDNVGKTAKEAIKEILGANTDITAVYSSRQYAILGDGLMDDDAGRIGHEILANDQVQRVLIFSRDNYRQTWGKIGIPAVVAGKQPETKTISLNTSSDHLMAISRDRKLSLNLEEMEMIRGYFESAQILEERRKMGLGIEPTDVELELLAQSWSEHCKHKIFNARINYREDDKVIEIDSLFKTYIKGATDKLAPKVGWIASAFWDNSGVLRINEKWLLGVKCETHNSPSNEEPYGGALTGIVGVYRDAMGTGVGAKLIFGTYGFCTGNPSYTGELRPKIHPRRLLDGVRQGVQDGGNKHGVPTPWGFTFFDDGYMAKPAIFVMAGGLIPAKSGTRRGEEKTTRPGDIIVMCGGRVGIDGIHGATESSMEAGKWISATHVQIGDPFTQKIMHDFLLEARDAEMFCGITDNGAGGLSSSVGEMAQFSNGCELDLDKVPLKYAGLAPWQILVSESQERMTLAVPPEKLDKLLELARQHGVEATALGKFTDTGKFFCRYRGQSVAFLDLDFVHKGNPQMILNAEWKTPLQRRLAEPKLRNVGDPIMFLKEMLARPNICGKEYIQRQYDHEVQATSAVKPYVGDHSDTNSDAAVIRIDLASDEGVAIATATNPDLGTIDTYWMAANAVDEAIRRVIAVGAEPSMIAFNDNFCWPSPLPGARNPDAEYKLAQLVRANRALYDMTLVYGAPLISGKDSMSMDGTVKNAAGGETRISAPPTLLVSAVARVAVVQKCVTMDAKSVGDAIYILGNTRDELGGSEYYLARHTAGVNAPKVFAAENRARYGKLHQAIEKSLVKSCHGLYKGGLAVSLARMAFGGGMGLDIDLERVPRQGLDFHADKIMYSESSGRLLVSVDPKNTAEFEAVMGGSDFARIGLVTADNRLTIKKGRKTVLSEDILRLKRSWQKQFQNF